MARQNKGITIFLTILLGVILQVALVVADQRDSPDKAVVEFATAYFSLDKAMADRLCSEKHMVDGVDVVQRYIDRAQKEARDRGFGLSFVRNNLYDIETRVIRLDDKQAEVHLSAIRKNPLRSFFSGESASVDQLLELVKEDGQWKVCGNLFALTTD